MKKTTILMTAMLLAGAVSAQDTVNGVYNERVVVVGSYKPTLEETQKVNVAPEISDTVSTQQLQHKFSYQINPKRITSIFSPSRIKAARVIGEPNTKLYNNYLKLGMGNYWSPLLEAYYSSTRNKTMSYGAYLTHRSSWGKIGRQVDSIPYSPDYYGANHWSMTDLGGFAKVIVKDKLQVSADLRYNNDYNLYYGVSDSTLQANGLNRDSLSLKDNKIAYNLIAFRGGVKNLQTDVNKLGYSAYLNVDELAATYGQNEFMMGLSGDIHYGFPLLSKYKGIAFLEAEWQGGRSSMKETSLVSGSPWGYVSTGAADTVRHSRNIVKMNPYVDFLFKDFNVHAGLKLGFDGYSDTAVHTYVFPDIMVSKSLMRESLNLSVGVTGDLEANTLNKIRQANPYLMPGADLKATHGMDFYAKMRMNFNKKLQLKAHADYALLKDDLNFLLASWVVCPLDNVYTPCYEDIRKATVGADFSFINDEMLVLELGANYYHYSDSLTLYRPTFDAHLNVSVNYNDKVTARLQTLLLGAMNGTILTDNLGNQMVGERLPMRTGLNLEVEYRHNKALSFFAKMDNILCQRYFYWTNYPSQRILVMLGMTYTIPTR